MSADIYRYTTIIELSDAPVTITHNLNTLDLMIMAFDDHNNDVTLLLTIAYLTVNTISISSSPWLKSPPPSGPLSIRVFA